MLKRRNQTRAVAMVGDQRPAAITPKIWHRFLHQETGFYQGEEPLPKITGYPGFFAAMYRVSRGHNQVKFTQLGTSPYSEHNTVLQRYVAFTEEVIRQ